MIVAFQQQYFDQANSLYLIDYHLLVRIFSQTGISLFFDWPFFGIQYPNAANYNNFEEMGSPNEAVHGLFLNDLTEIDLPL